MQMYVRETKEKHIIMNLGESKRPIEFTGIIESCGNIAFEFSDENDKDLATVTLTRINTELIKENCESESVYIDDCMYQIFEIPELIPPKLINGSCGGRKGYFKDFIYTLFNTADAYSMDAIDGLRAFFFRNKETNNINAIKNAINTNFYIVSDIVIGKDCEAEINLILEHLGKTLNSFYPGEKYTTIILPSYLYNLKVKGYESLYGDFCVQTTKNEYLITEYVEYV